MSSVVQPRGSMLEDASPSRRVIPQYRPRSHPPLNSYLLISTPGSDCRSAFTASALRSVFRRSISLRPGIFLIVRRVNWQLRNSSESRPGKADRSADVVLRASTGQLTVDKILTTHGNLLEGLFRGVDQVLRTARLQARDIDGVIVHATTVVTNALIERRGSRTALITTRGFPDVLSIRNEHRYDMYDPQIEFADPLVPRDDTFEIDERVLADGTILQAVDPAAIERLATTLRERGVVSAAICLINSAPA